MPDMANGKMIDYGKTVDVRVGDLSKLFTLHEHLLTSHSQFFKREIALAEEKGLTKMLCMDDIGWHGFQAYVHWLYTGMIIKIQKKNKETQERCHHLIKLYVLGEQLENIRFKNEVMTALINVEEEATCHDFNVNEIMIAYNGSSVGSELRRFVVHSHILKPPLCGTAAFVGNERDFLPADFAFDLALKLAEQPDIEVLAEMRRQPCFYHQHNDEVPKCGGQQVEEAEECDSKDGYCSA